jgi:hypothetical protein
MDGPAWNAVSLSLPDRAAAPPAPTAEIAGDTDDRAILEALPSSRALVGNPTFPEATLTPHPGLGVLLGLADAAIAAHLQAARTPTAEW